MPSFYEYWNGDACAHLDKQQIPDSLCNKTGWIDHSRKLMNTAFRFYYDGMTAIKAFQEANPNSSSDLADPSSIARVQNRLPSLMLADLRDAAFTGWGLGVHDLNDAFHHLEANNGRWTDTGTTWYQGHVDKKGTYGNCDTAFFAANFLTAYEERAKAVADNIAKMNAGLTKCEGVLERIRNSDSVGTQEWKEFGDACKEVETWSGRVEKCLWMVRLTRDPHSVTASALELSEKAGEAVGSCLSAIALVRDTVDFYDESLKSGLSAKDSAALVATKAGFDGVGAAAGFVEGAGTVAGGMAILLACYGAAIAAIPGIYKGFSGIVQRRNYMAAQMGVDLRLTGP